jgi:DNA-binding PadR family transcriptional regulator
MIPRELIKGTLKYMVLNLLQTLPRMYGYEITQVLDEKSSGRKN